MRTRRQDFNRLAAIGLCALLPVLLGGCPEFRNGTVDAIDAGTRSVLFSDVETGMAVDTVTNGVLNSALDLFFEQFRTQDVRR